MKKMFFVAIFFIFLTSCANTVTPVKSSQYDGQYDYNNFLVNPSEMKLENAAESVLKIVTETIFIGAEEKEFKNLARGGGMIVGNKYVLTLGHVVSQKALTVPTQFGPVHLPYPKKREDVFVMKNGLKYLLEKIYVNEEEDIALLKLPEGVHLPSFPFPFGNSDEIKIGNFVYILGSPMAIGVNVRPGIVSSLSLPNNTEKTKAFMLSAALVPGDSGSPVLAIRDGRFEVIGLAKGLIDGNVRLGFVSRINAIKEKLKENIYPEIFKKLGLQK